MKLTEVLKRNPILNKPQMYKLYENGEFGNKFPCWSSLKFYYDSDYTLPVNFRYKGKGSGKFVYYNMNKEETVQKYCKLLMEDYKPSDIHITGGDIGTDRLLNGEITYMDGNYYLFYSTVNKVMREALAEKSFEVENQKVFDILYKYIDHNSLINFNNLFTWYPNHVIEFTVYPFPIGEKNWNTIFWECRYY